MDDVAVIDRFLNTFSTYIDSGFGLLNGEVAFLTATLVAIDMTLAGLFWAMGHASGQGEDVMAKLIRKVLYVGAFAYIIGNFNSLSGIVFRSFAGLGLQASVLKGPVQQLHAGTAMLLESNQEGLGKGQRQIGTDQDGKVVTAQHQRTSRQYLATGVGQ